MTDRREEPLDQDASDDIARCPKCGEPHPDSVIKFAKIFGASVALCRKCTASEKREKFGIDDH